MSKYTEKGNGFKQEPGYGRVVDGKIYIGIVKNNKDAMKMGRLEVWVPEMGGIPTDSGSWHIVSYASPFAGATSIDENVENSEMETGSQKSYGWWAVPPDLNNQVLCCFVNGEATKGYWFACLWQQNMNHMVPGLASNSSFQTGQQGILPPVVEYNKDQSSTGNLDPQNPRRPRFDVLHEAFKKQGLYTDFQRGPASTSARRESPSKAFGLLTPRSNQLYIDDNPDNEFIRLRTRSGVQVLIHDTGGFVYINSGTGNSWLEVSDAGIDMYTAGNFSVRADGDINLTAGGNVNIAAGKNINSLSGEHTNISSGLDLNLLASQELRLTAGTNLHFSASSDLIMGAGGKIGMKSATHDTMAANINRDGSIKDNGGASVPDATVARRAKEPSRIPRHEPWTGHPKAGMTANIPPTASTAGTVNAPKPISQVPKATINPKVQQLTGDGASKNVPYDATKLGTVKVGTRTVANNVESAISSAAKKTGVNYGYMMAMAEKESSFNPDAKAKTSSASGLYQFTDGTWEEMVRKNPQYGYTVADKANPEAQAVMAGLYANQNRKVIERVTGRTATNTDLYLGHFLGGAGAVKFLTADPNESAAQVSGSRAANANRNIYYENGDMSKPRTVGQVQILFANQIEPKSVAYGNNQPKTA